MLYYLLLIFFFGNINILDGYLILDVKIFLNNLLSFFMNKKLCLIKIFFCKLIKNMEISG